MKALVLTDYFKFEYKDVPLPEYGDDEALVKVGACSICGSDVHGYDERQRPAVSPPSLWGTRPPARSRRSERP